MAERPIDPDHPGGTSPEDRSRNVDRFNHDEDAPEYDEDVLDESDPIREGYGELLRWVAREAGITDRDRVLELGSGTGNLTLLLPDSAELVCVDVSREMTRRAEAKLRRAGRGLPTFLEEDVLAALRRAPDRAFDHILSTYTLHHLEEDEKVAFFGEARRVLAEHGRLVVGDLMFEDDGKAAAILDRYREQGNGELAEEIEDEFFWNLSVCVPALEGLGFEVRTRRFSELSWGLAGER